MEKDKEIVSSTEDRLQALFGQLMQTDDELAKEKLQKQIDSLRQTAEDQADTERQLVRFRGED